MNATHEKLFLELRQTKKEIENSLKNKQSQEWLTTILEEELSDIMTAIQKLESGNFGLCEISGEFLPNEALNMIPTLKSQKDTEYLVSYYKKPIYHSF
jgi:RNA polymerase-binding transcription factor DksA